MDTHRLQEALAQAWGELRDGPILEWLTPSTGVRWFRADGAQEQWLARGAQLMRDPSRSPRTSAPFSAIEVPDAIVLRRYLTLPALAPAAAAQAIGLEAATHSPFPPGELVWGARSTPAEGRRGQQGVEIALASRRLIQQHLAAQQEAPALESSEVWCLAERAGEPIILRGFAEARRQRAQRRKRNINIGLMASALVLLAAIAVTPSLQLRARTVAAAQDYERLTRLAAPALSQRESFVRSEEQLSELRTILGEQGDPLQVLDLLTRALPDDSSLLTLQVQGQKVTMTGQTANSAALLEGLGNQPGLREVRAPTAATRPPGATKETFSVEAQISPAVLHAAPSPATPEDTAAQPDLAAPAAPAAQPKASTP